MPGSSGKMTNAEVVYAMVADQRAGAVAAVLNAIEQAGRGLVKVRNQLGTGVPQGNEVHYLIAVQGYVNEAAFILSTLAIPPAAPEAEGKKLVLA